MELIRTEEQRVLADIVRGLLAEASPPERVAEVADGQDTMDRVLWSRLGSELGVTGLLVPEQHGGVGATWREVSEVVGELGRALACVPFVPSCVLAVTTILAADDSDAAAAHLPGIAAGERIATIAMVDATGRIHPDRLPVRASGGGPWSLAGEALFVPYGADADLVLVLAATDRGPTWFAVATDAPGCEVQAMDVLDATRPLSSVRFADAPATAVGAVGDGWAIAEHVVDAASMALACEQAATAAHLVDLSVQYAKDRLQFGQPIGSFQAIQHRVADMHLLADEATSAVAYAVWAAADSPGRVREAASLAAIVCGDAMRTIAEETVQVHGGIGFTWEHVAHRYVRRAHTSRTAFGSPDWHRDRLVDAIGM